MLRSQRTRDRRFDCRSERPIHFRDHCGVASVPFLQSSQENSQWNSDCDPAPGCSSHLLCNRDFEFLRNQHQYPEPICGTKQPASTAAGFAMRSHREITMERSIGNKDRQTTTLNQSCGQPYLNRISNSSALDCRGLGFLLLWLRQWFSKIPAYQLTITNHGLVERKMMLQQVCGQFCSSTIFQNHGDHLMQTQWVYQMACALISLYISAFSE